MDKKKQMERSQLTKFVSNEKLKFLIYQIIDSETPDFEVNVNKKWVSVEHTRLINPELQQKESYRDKIIKTAQKRFEDKYSDKLYVLLTFRNIHLKGGRIAEEKYINEVYNLIEEIYLNNRNHEFRINAKRNKSKVSDSIERFSVDNVQNFSHWQHFGAYLVERIDKNWLENIIKKKESNIQKYEKHYEENWLLMVSDFGTKASSSSTDNIDFSYINTKFDKIFIYSYMADEVTVLK